MRHGWLWLLVAWLASSGPVRAQAQPEPTEAKLPPDAKTPASVTLEAPLALAAPADCPAGNRVWARTDYLLWWLRPAPLPVPLVTTGNPLVGFNPNPAATINTAGAIGQPGTRVLLGEGTIPFAPASGIRPALGGWIDDDQRFGVEGSAFWLQQLSNTFSAASNSAGNPPLYFPIFSAIAGAERAIPIADPLRQFSGGVSVTSSAQLWGAELNFMYAVYRADGMQWILLAGGRYADLREDLRINNTTQDLLFGNIATLNDSFATRNNFYGGQIGSRFVMQIDRFFLDVTGKVALGETRQQVAIAGDIAQPGPNALTPPGAGVFPGGLFAQSTNIGQHKTSPLTVPFSTLASVELRIGYAITTWLRAFAGYDVLIWTNVVRPGEQINHTVNLTQNAVLDPNGLGRLVGPAQPAPLSNRSDFWAQGVSFGIECRY
jgi:hypothetical protein